MAKRGAKSSGAAAPSKLDEASSLVTPAPPKDLYVTLTTLVAGEVLHRIHLEKYDADQFNPGIQGNARFSPIQDEWGEPIPTLLYAGATMPCALMETVFHDVPHVPGFKSFDKGKLVSKQHSTVEVTQDLQLADLGSLPVAAQARHPAQAVDRHREGPVPGHAKVGREG